MISVRYDDPSKVSVSDAINVSGNIYSHKYPCSTSDCTPYAILFNPGMYKIELWGASGGFLDNLGAHGSYTSGLLPIYSPRTLYIYLGQKGEWAGQATFNGGGKGTVNVTNPENHVSGGSGGGASDLRLTNGPWKNFESLKSRIEVAAGGAGTSFYNDIPIDGGAGGVLEGYNGTIRYCYQPYKITNSSGGTQTSGGLGSNSSGINGGFGYGGDCGSGHHGSGGGGGYYGGGSGGFVSCRVTSGSGGSSYISGFDGCRAIAKDSKPNSIHHTWSSLHYSGLRFYSPSIKDGMSEIPCTNSTIDESCTQIGNYGHGFARITIYEQHDPVTIKRCHPLINNFYISVFILIYSE
ncbi:PE-PGRS protein, putative [Trichomonas vaginalis G3]|uniref:receptor protein-tyrosine kinase n=1 Tax=Trichomonas vaginalis (strain ATCC PRA-98 / G3) TaxID=412133 RepID=A2DMT7_TRIV3|nr:glycine-rich protein family [Trichomonas vaginalis G3]EAY18308.1 PE-PGRS protein, putative [Trichomonas vaginalis G3]KAI5541869.1 glycine-rich protein family [Trichomonas vaginalis G3]|eukprot:XP_001579294.1 PE-PGRS protein [Trichomonas vaginalis G3]